MNVLELGFSWTTHIWKTERTKKKHVTFQCHPVCHEQTAYAHDRDRTMSRSWPLPLRQSDSHRVTHVTSSIFPTMSRDSRLKKRLFISKFKLDSFPLLENKENKEIFEFQGIKWYQKKIQTPNTQIKRQLNAVITKKDV